MKTVLVLAFVFCTMAVVMDSARTYFPGLVQ